MLISPVARFIYAVCCVSAIMSMRWPHSLWLWGTLALLAGTLAADAKRTWVAHRLQRQRVAEAAVNRDAFAEYLRRAAVGHAWWYFPADVEDRAWTLLLDSLSRAGRETLQHHGYFYVRGNRGTCYRIRAEPTFNVEELNVWLQLPLVQLCMTPIEQVPKGDFLLAQKLLLEADEDRFWQLANKRPVTGNIAPHMAERPPWLRPGYDAQMAGRHAPHRAASS